LAAERAVGAVVVVGVGELVELVLEGGQAVGWGLAGEPALGAAWFKDSEGNLLAIVQLPVGAVDRPDT
jgi:hypothetical protein